MHLREGHIRSGPLPFFQTDQTGHLILLPSKLKSEYNNFLNHKKVLKTDKQNLCENYFILCFYNCIAVLLPVLL